MIELPAIDEPPQQVRLHRLRLPLRSVHRAAHGEESMRDVVLLGWTTADSVTGWAECPTLSRPGYVTETTDQAWRALVDRLVPAVIDGGLGALGADATVLAAPSAVRDAALDASLRGSAMSLRSALGAARLAVPRCAVLADVDADPRLLAERAARAVGAGAQMVKLKIRPGADIAAIAAVQAAVPGVPVAADANGSYSDASVADAAGVCTDALRALDDMGLDYLEQPLHHRVSWDDLAALCDAMATPVALDESLSSLDQVRSALRLGAVDVVSLKPARMGGVVVAAEAARLAGERGVAAFVGGMLETGIGRAAAVAVASMSQCSIPSDLGPSRAYFDADVCEPLELDPQGRLSVPDGEGIGRTPDPASLDRFTVDQVTFSRGDATPRRGVDRV